MPGHRRSVIELSNFRWNLSENSFTSEHTKQNFRSSHEFLPEQRSARGSRPSIYFQEVPNPNSVTFPNALESTAEPGPWRDCSKGFGTLKRTFSLNLRSKGPKTLGAELQSIMDKHYEMTGIRMVTASSRSASYMGLKSSTQTDGPWYGKLTQSKTSVSLLAVNLKFALHTANQAKFFRLLYAFIHMLVYTFIHTRMYLCMWAHVRVHVCVQHVSFPLLVCKLQCDTVCQNANALVIP